MKRILEREDVPAEVHEIAEAWQKRARFEPAHHAAPLHAIFQEIPRVPAREWDSERSLRSILARYPKEGKGFYSKANLVAGYRHLIEEGDLDPDPVVMERIRMKPMRTASGVAPVTVLTAPAGCPARCIFCPDDWRMPKSYIYDEPGAMRAERDGFDPFRQTYGRIQSFENIGHDASKVELLILGGTWSAYSRDYREWFVRRCYDAMNAVGDPSYTDAPSLEAAQQHNITAAHRNVGLVIETRPDWVTPEEIRHLRRLGVTKVQIGVQSLDDNILALNNRGHGVEAVRQALGLLRTAGFKLHLHWMPNLHGATPQSDRADFARFFSDPAIRPDELKIYPCSLIADTELYSLWEKGEYHPYSEAELVDLLADIKPTIPAYTRVNRLFRDIPAHHIQAGVTASNLREIVHAELDRRGQHCGCIRCREVRRQTVREEELRLLDSVYETDLTIEHFLHFVVAENGDIGYQILGSDAHDAQYPISNTQYPLAAFLRLSLPKTTDAGSRAFLDEIRGNAMIREVHVYGPALALGKDEPGAAQHVGLGSRLLAEARRISQAAGFERISVIAATGTRDYYANRGFAQGELYMTGRTNL
jgi:elongator complex protein 3